MQRLVKPEGNDTCKKKCTDKKCGSGKNGKHNWNEWKFRKSNGTRYRSCQNDGCGCLVIVPLNK